ncbi:MAG: hypothetical protein K6G82_07550 [Ruminococcus sp.]|nr:hypothetical protein [Ruminococcus sp.]
MSKFIFNGKSSDGLGLMITQPLIRPSWAREVNEISAPGRTSKIMQFSKTYANASLPVHTVIMDSSLENVRKIYAALSGYGQLQLSSSAEEFVYAYAEPLVPEAVAMHTAELLINFRCMPFAYAVEPTVVQLTAQRKLVHNAGKVFSAPEIMFTATGQRVVVTVNGIDFIVNLTQEVQNEVIIIDCEAEVTYYEENGQKISINAQTENDYPMLHTGDNYASITGAVSDAYITVRERWY